MKLKRFQAADTSRAMRMIREAFGPDAVILSNQRIEGGVEIVAAVDYDEAVIKQQASSQALTYLPDQDIPVSKPANIDTVKDELEQLRELVQEQLAGFAWQNRVQHNPVQVKILNKLVATGFPIDFSEQMVSRLNGQMDTDSAWSQVQNRLVELLPSLQHDVIEQGGVHAFLGPTGVGKTTTIAKLAARFALRFGANNLALITADNYRVGAKEQLITYAKILGVDVSTIESNQDLERLMARMKNKQLVLIDTAGMSQRDQRVAEQLSLLTEQGYPIKKHLLIAANSQASVVTQSIKTFGAKQIDAAIVTKLDETANLASILAVLIKQQLPCMYYTDGQRVPEDIHHGQPQQLVKQAISIGKLYRDPVKEEVVAKALLGSVSYAE